MDIDKFSCIIIYNSKNNENEYICGFSPCIKEKAYNKKNKIS